MRPIVRTPAVASAAAAALLFSALAMPSGALAGAVNPAAAGPEGASDTAAMREAAPEEDGPNTGAFSITVDNSFTTAYMFRGIMNQRDGLIWQPSIELAMNLFEAEEGIVRSVDAGMGIWISYQTNNIGPWAPGTDNLYETDYYPSLWVTWAGGVTTGLTYYAYTSPDHSFREVDEVNIDISYDDSELLGAWSMQPSATIAIETHSTSFGTGKGSSLELGVEPGAEVKLPFADSEKYPVGISVPVKLGLSIDHYYDDGTRNEVFGYALVGLHASLPIACVPARYGKWSVTNGFDVYFLNDALEAYQSTTFGSGDPVYPVWTSSITMEY